MVEENKTVRNASSLSSIERDDLSSDLKPSLVEASRNLINVDEGYTLSMQLSKTQGAYGDTL